MSKEDDEDNEIVNEDNDSDDEDYDDVDEEEEEESEEESDEKIEEGEEEVLVNEDIEMEYTLKNKMVEVNSNVNFKKMTLTEETNLLKTLVKLIETSKIILSEEDKKKIYCNNGNSDSLAYMLVKLRNEINLPCKIERVLKGNKVVFIEPRNLYTNSQFETRDLDMDEDEVTITEGYFLGKFD